MAAEIKREIALEIGHVLFIDVVGYSKLSLAQQRAAIEELNEIVRGSGQFQKSEADGQLLKLATGDGMALVFTTSPQAPTQCAVEVARTLKSRPHILVRMGVHSGPVSGIVDVGGKTNVAGAGINIAQRVMSCGDAGHILLSKHSAEDLTEFERWRPRLHDLGTVAVKHGARIELVNLHDDEIGNPAVPGKLCTWKHRRLWRRAALAAALLVVLGIIAGVIWLSRVRTAPPEKSIAVLPFENLSRDPDNAYFADGVQDEILANLAKVADLKVISRTSVMQYRNAAVRNLRDVGQELGVAHVVEGSVQRSGSRVRVDAQLINARTDAHEWAEHYDRDLADMFGIQSEIAKAIADQLQAKLSPNEKAAIEKAPTTDLVAFDFYTRAKTLVLNFGFSGEKKAADVYKAAADLLTNAIARDHDFFLAHCLLAEVQCYLYFFGFDHTAARRAMAEEAVQNAQRLRPDAGETHLALAAYFYRCQLEYDRAREELQIAARLLPNNPAVYSEMGFIDRRQGRSEDALRNLEKAAQLDPRNVSLLRQISLSYRSLYRYKDMAAILERCLAIDPNDIDTRVGRALVELHWHADPQPLHETIHQLISDKLSTPTDLADWWFTCAMCERDSAEIDASLAAISELGVRDENLIFPRAFCVGFAQHLKGDIASAQASFAEAHTQQERVTHEQPDYGPALCVLGVIDAALGRKDDAISEGRRASEMVPLEKNSVDGASINKNLAVIYAWCGQKNLAIEQIKSVLQHPSDLSYGMLKLHPYWDPLRDDPRFEKLVQSLAPKE